MIEFVSRACLGHERQSMKILRNNSKNKREKLKNTSKSMKEPYGAYFSKQVFYAFRCFNDVANFPKTTSFFRGSFTNGEKTGHAVA